MKKTTVSEMVKRSGVKKGETILIHYWGEEDQIAVADYFMEAVASMGASPMFLWQSRKRNFSLFQDMNEYVFEENYFSFLDKVDAVLDIFAYQPVMLNQPLNDEQMNHYRMYMKQLFQVLMQKERFTQIRIPTLDNAMESELEPEDFMNRMEAAYDISYDQLIQDIEKDKMKYDEAGQITIHTADDCSLTFGLNNRTFIPDCGDGDWPCGELYVAPEEEKTNGKVYFEKLFVEEVGVFQDVILSVEDGRVKGCNQEEMQNWINTLSEEDRVVCELGFGYNPNITSLCGYTVLDEKMKGTFHIALGDNRMFGGKNEGTIHVDLVGKGKIEIEEIR